MLSVPEWISWRVQHDMYAWAESEHLVPLEIALVLGVDPTNRRFPGLGQPLIGAVQAGTLKSVKLLVKYGADVNVSSKYGETPLQAAVSTGSADIAAFLLASHADPNAATPDGTPLMIAVKGCRVALVRLLLDAGADPDFHPPFFRATARQLAEASGCKEARMLFDR
jgi:ankyrin repeat protein